MLSLKSPHRGDFDEYTQYIIFNIKKEIILNYPKSAAMGFFKGLKNKFETAVVNEPPVFEPLKFRWIMLNFAFSDWSGITLYNTTLAIARAL